MARSGCTGPMCQFLWANSQPRAKAGRCTGEGGIISNFENDEILTETGPSHGTVKRPIPTCWFTTPWVAYMTSTTKAMGTTHWMGFNLGGTIDWAVNLQISANPGEKFKGGPEVTNGQCNGSDCVEYR